MMIIIGLGRTIRQPKLPVDRTIIYSDNIYKESFIIYWVTHISNIKYVMPAPLDLVLMAVATAMKHRARLTLRGPHTPYIIYPFDLPAPGFSNGGRSDRSTALLPPERRRALEPRGENLDPSRIAEELVLELRRGLAVL